MIFPLPTTVFERYMLADDRPWQPMAFTIRLKFSGSLSVDDFRAALAEAVRREPLLTARVDFRGRRPVWVAGPDEPPHCDVAPLGTPLEFPSVAKIDLAREAGLRTWVRHGDDRTELWFQFHHACCDGVGSFWFLDDLLRIYDRRIRPDSTAVPTPLEPERLRRRCEFGESLGERLKRLPLKMLLVPISVAFQTFLKSMRLAVPKVPQLDDRQLRRVPELPVVQFDAECIRQLTAQAKAADAKLNDLLMAEMFKALWLWQVDTTGKPFEDWLRLAVPINARTAEDRVTPATNIVGMILMGRRPFRIRNPARRLSSVSRHLRVGRSIGGASVFWSCMRTFELLYGGFRNYLTPERCTGTATFGNMGRIFGDSPLLGSDGKLHAGGLTLDDVESAPPTRPNTLISITAHHYAGTLRYAMNYDRTAMAADDAARLLEHIAARMRTTAAAGAAT